MKRLSCTRRHSTRSRSDATPCSCESERHPTPVTTHCEPSRPRCSAASPSSLAQDDPTPATEGDHAPRMNTLGAPDPSAGTAYVSVESEPDDARGKAYSTVELSSHST